jgi:hypothetical protein
MKYAELERGATLPTEATLRERFDELARMPALLAEVVARTSDGARRTRPAPDAFSLHEHVWHLRDIEVLGYSRRLRALANESEPFLADLDGTRLAVEGRYHELPLERGLAEFVEARESNRAFARLLPLASFGRRGEMEGVGCLTLAELIELWRNHDAGHADELAAFR